MRTRSNAFLILVLLSASACGTDELLGDSGDSGAAGSDGGVSAVPDGASGPDATLDAAPPDGSTLACVFEHEVTLPGHEGQFFGNANSFCRTFVAGIPNKPVVVVGSDAAGVGDHDCLLGRAVRYHVDWGDGICTWTERAEKCDRGVGVEHAYAKPGTYTAWVFAQDDDGLRTRKDDKVFTVHQTGGDVSVSASQGQRSGTTLKFTQTLGAYGNFVVDKLTVAYRLVECDGTETELERREFPLPASFATTHQSITSSPVELTVPLSVTKGRVVLEVDPDTTLAETCPTVGTSPSTRGVNNLSAVDLESCPIFQ